MAFSVGNEVFSSVSNIDDKKSLFLLRKIMTLDMLGCKAPDDHELNSTVTNLIDRYLKTPDQASDGIKKELQGLTLVQPSLGNYSVKEIFHIALSHLTGVNLDSFQEKHLNRLYMEQFLTWMQEEIKDLPDGSDLLLLNIYYSFSDLLIDLDTGIWQALLSLQWGASQRKSLNQFKSKYESLRFCALKTPLIEINTRDPLIEPTRDIQKMRRLYISWRTLLEMIVPYLDKDQEKYIIKSLNRSKKLIREGNQISDKEFINHAKDMIPRILTNFEKTRQEYRMKILTVSSSLFVKVCELYSQCSRDCLKDRDDQVEQGIQTILDNHLQETLKRADEEIRQRQKTKTELESALQRIQAAIDEIPLIMEKEETLSAIEKKEILLISLSLEEDKQKVSFLIKEEASCLELVSTSHEEFRDIYEKSGSLLKGREHLINKEELQRFKIFIKTKILDLTLKERSLSSIILLGRDLAHLLSREDLLISRIEKNKRLVYEAAVEKIEDFSKKHVIASRKSLLKTSSVVEDLSTDSENTSAEDSEEESSLSCLSKSFDSTLEFSEPSDSILENHGVNRYLTELKKGKNIQLNGVLSQTVDGLLQALKTHLLRMKTPADLKDQYDLQTKEIFDHLLLGTAGLELLVQAVCDRKTNPLALGFRTTLLHCYYAIEQKLSQRSIEFLDKGDQKHHLLYLAEKAKIPDLKKWQNFLQEMTLHLAFCYPGEHRLFSQQKAFSLLEDLSAPDLDNNKLKEVLEFCFEMYSKSIAFIAEISFFPIENQPNFLGIIQDVKEQIIRTLYELPTKKILSAQSGEQLQELDPILVKVKQILSTLQPSLKNLKPLMFGEKEQKIYTAIDTIQNYLEFMRSSLEISQDSSQHSLQKFLKIETLANIDKLFKHLFRVAILMKKGADEHQHALVKLFASIADFYKREDEQAILSHVKDINLNISHHYLHVSGNHSELYSIYKKALSQAYSLLHISDEHTVLDKDEHIVVNKKVKKSVRHLRENTVKVNQLVNKSLDLFIELLKPTLEELKEQYLITAVA